MTGSPVFRTFLAILCLAGLSVLLFRLTAAAPAVIAGPGERTTESAPVPLRLRFRCSQLPASLQLASGALQLMGLHPPTATNFATEASLTIPAEGLELTLNATWPESAVGDKAITLEVEPDERAAQSQTAWSDASSLTAYLSYQWK